MMTSSFCALMEMGSGVWVEETDASGIDPCESEIDGPIPYRSQGQVKLKRFCKRNLFENL